MLNNQMLNMMINQILARNPEARELYNNLKGKNESELKQYAENVAQGKGTNLKTFLGNLGIRY